MNKRSSQLISVAVAIGALLFATMSVTPQTGGVSRYVYDDNGRLHAVIAPSGEAAVYDYDAAGNLSAIRRLAANSVAILDFSPHEGDPGSTVKIIGLGFNAGVNTVSFNGVSAQIVSVTPPFVTATVPAAATTGFISVTTPGGNATSERQFKVRELSINPKTATRVAGETLQFTLVFQSSSDTTVNWSVNGIDGGNATVGTVTAAGLYTTPSQLGNVQASIFTVRATSVAIPSLFGEARVTVRNPDFIRGIQAGAVSVRVGLPTNTLPPVSMFGSGVSVRVGTPPDALPSTSSFGTGVSVSRGLPPGVLPNVSSMGTGVLVRKGLPNDLLPEVSTFGTGVAVRVGPGRDVLSATSTLGTGVSVTNEPSIVSVSPSQIARGSVTVITISGANLSGATGVSFIDGSSAIDSNIVASNLSVNPGGTSLTVTVTVGSNSALGTHIVFVTAAAGRSPGSNIGINTIEITQ